ncbi:helix-turn-helix domain-containing protein, partial [Prosthecobacter sp.]
MPKARKTAANPLSRYKVPILDRTLDLLELLSRHPEGLTLTAMTEALAMPKNSVFRIATTLTLRGYADRDEGTKA